MAGRGLDIEGVQRVINFDMPKTIEAAKKTRAFFANSSENNGKQKKTGHTHMYIYIYIHTSNASVCVYIIMFPITTAVLGATPLSHPSATKL